MTWFKVDDGLHSHKKAVRAGIPAMGLWVMAGSWCADQLTNGWLPDYIAMRLDPDYEVHAKALVQVGLWVEEVRDEEPGWRFHEWNEPGRQPTKDQVLADRAAAADRQKKARDRAKAQREGSSRGESQDDSEDRHGVTTPVTNGVTHADVTGAVTVPPSRPVPTRPELPTEVSKPLAPSRPDSGQIALIEHAGPLQRQIKANDVVAAFHDGARAEKRKVTQDSTKKVSGTAKRLLDQNPDITDQEFLDAAFRMGRRGFDNLSAEIMRGEQPRQNGGLGTTRHRVQDSHTDTERFKENI